MAAPATDKVPHGIRSPGDVLARASAQSAGRYSLGRAARLLAALLLVFLWGTSLTGCGTTKWSDTPRTATEQLLISDAVDRAVTEIDFTTLANKQVYFDPTYLKGSVDENYVVSSLRQHLLASGCLLMESRDLADYVVEARSGAVGTDRSDLLFGVPSVNVPTVPGMPVAMPSSIPEIPLAKTTNQKAVAKLAVFAYNRKTGRPVLQSGVDPAVSTARDSWLFGAGPFRRGTVYENNHELDSGVDIPIIGGRDRTDDYSGRTLPVTAAAVFPEPATEQLNPAAIAGADPSASPAPAAAGNQTARLPSVDHSRLNSPAGAQPTGTAGGAVQRAQWIERSRGASPAAPATPAAEPRSSWGAIWPGNWFGNGR